MPHRIAFVVYPGFQLLDAAGPVSAFEIAGHYAPGAYELTLVAAGAGEVPSSSGATMIARPLPRRMPDTLLVAGGLGVHEAAQERRTLRFLRQAAVQCGRVASVCTGAFLLAEAGLLDGRRATTHWFHSKGFAQRHPQVKLEPDRIYVRDGKLWTAAGITAGIDLALAMIAADYGEAVARSTAQHLVVYHRRPGGQSQFSALVEMGGQEGRFAGLLDWMRQRLGDELTIERLARRAAMSPRNFARAFHAETGMTPAKAVERLRLEVARERVERAAEPIDMVARRVGFGDPERMRRAFIRAFGQPPQALRRSARA